MATFDAATSGPELTGSEDSIAWDHTCAGNLLLVGVRTRDTTATLGLGLATAVTYNGIPLTLAIQNEYQTFGLGNACAQLWYLVNPPAGEHEIVVEWGGVVTRGGAAATSWAGVDQTAPIEDTSTSQGEGIITDLALTSSTPNAVAVDCLYSMASGAAADGVGQIQREYQLYGVFSFADLGAMSSIPIATPGSVDFVWEHSGGESAFWSTVGVVLKEAETAQVLDADAGDFRITGADVGLRAQRRVSANAGLFRFSGAAVNLTRSRRLSADAGNFRFSGGDLGLTRNRVVEAEAGDFRFQGGAVALRHHRLLPLDAGEFRFTGGAVDFSRSYRLAADAGQFAFAGGEVGFDTSRLLRADAGNFRFAGGDVDLTVQGSTETVLSADAGRFTFSGASVSLRASRAVPIDAGSFGISGAGVTLMVSRRLSVEPGNFRFQGAAVDLIAERDLTLSVDPGLFTITGADVRLGLGRQLAADAGRFAFQGQPVDMDRDRRLKVEPGRFVIRGARVRLHYSGEPPNTGADRGGVARGVTTSIIERVTA